MTHTIDEGVNLLDKKIDALGELLLNEIRISQQALLMQLNRSDQEVKEATQEIEKLSSRRDGLQKNLDDINKKLYEKQ